MSKATFTWIVGFVLAAGLGACARPSETVPPPTIQSSSWITPGSASGMEWKQEYLPGIGKALVLSIPDDAITEESIRSSVVLVYGRLNGYSPGIWPVNKVGLMRLMVSYKLGPNSRTDVWSAMPSPGKMSILLTNADNEYAPWGQSNLHSFRYVLVPKYDPSTQGKKPISGSSTLLSRYSETDLRTMSYEQFCQVAGLPK